MKDWMEVADLERYAGVENLEAGLSLSQHLKFTR